MALSIGAKSKNQAAAWKFIEYLTSEAVQDKYVKSSHDELEVQLHEARDRGDEQPEVFDAQPVRLQST